MIDIYFESLRVGWIAVETGQPHFVYDSDWTARANAFPVSLGMPLSSAPVDAARLVPWLANLLPESHLSEIGQWLGVSPQDIIGLLQHIGRDTAGALSIGQKRDGQDQFRKIRNDAELERIINELPNKPFLVGDDGISMSLAGVQDKLPVALVDGKVAIPVNGTPSTHILKPDAPRLAGSVFNEAFCLTLARAAGLDAARATTGRAGKRTYLLVERYDRQASARGILRTHQEDFCQLLGRFPSAKYEGRSGTGLTLVDLFSGVANNVSPSARLALRDAVILNVLIGNTDSHAKNYSLQIGAGGTARLAPLYDLLCAQVYPQLAPHLPQAINGKREAIHLFGTDWQQFAKAVGLAPAQTVRRVAELAASLLDRIDAALAAVRAMPAGDDPVLDKIAFQIRKRIKRIVKQLDQVAPSSA